MSDGSFSPGARAAIYEVGGGRCIGCGNTNLSAQHRHARGKGGTSRAVIGSPANGLPLCGGALAGVTGCHGFAEHHPDIARLLGWRVDGDPTGVPFWTRFGWYAWVQENDGCWLVAYVDPSDLDRAAEREAAVAALLAALAGPTARPA